MRRCLERGMRVYLLEWLEPAADQDHFGLADYADRLTDWAANVISAATGSDRLILAGHSIGETFAAIYASLHPERVAALVLVDSPLAFAEHGGPIAQAVAAMPHARHIRSSASNPCSACTHTNACGRRSSTGRVCKVCASLLPSQGREADSKCRSRCSAASAEQLAQQAAKASRLAGRWLSRTTGARLASLPASGRAGPAQDRCDTQLVMGTQIRQLERNIQRKALALRAVVEKQLIQTMQQHVRIAPSCGNLIDHMRELGRGDDQQCLHVGVLQQPAGAIVERLAR